VALWLETIEVSSRIEDWATLCQLVFSHWGKDQHHNFMRQILSLKQSGTVAEYIENLMTYNTYFSYMILPLALYSLWHNILKD
jgi:hypothetical protein